MEVRVYQQPDGIVYLAGIPYNHGFLGDLGWEWAKGIPSPGMWYTRDPELIKRACRKLNLPVEKTPRLAG